MKYTGMEWESEDRVFCKEREAGWYRTECYTIKEREILERFLDKEWESGIEHIVTCTA